MSNGKDQHSVMLHLVAVQSDVTGLSARDDQLSHVVFNRTPNQWMVFENLYCLRNQFSRFHGRGRLCFEEEIGESFEISERASGIDQLRQDLAFGLEATLP